MPSVSSNGPDWIRRQKARRDREREGLGPVRRFLATLFGRSDPREPGAAGASGDVATGADHDAAAGEGRP